LLESPNLLTSLVEMVNTCNHNGRSSQPENENANWNKNRDQNKNLKALTTLATQLVDLLARGANGNRGGGHNENEQHGCNFEQFNKQHPLTFEGQLDAVAMENWTTQIEKLIKVMRCTDD
jgi:hypothetical protein